MKLTSSKLYLIVIAVLIIIIVFLRSCSGPNGDCPPLEKSSSITKIDTVWLEKKSDTVYIPSIVKIIPGKTEYIDKPIDTLAVVSDYFSKVIYKDIVLIDSLGSLTIIDTLYQNRIYSRNTILDIKIPTITKTITNTLVVPPRNQVYIGLELGGSQAQPINYFGANLTLKNKRDQIYSIGAGLAPGGIGYKIGSAWKIKIK